MRSPASGQGDNDDETLGTSPFFDKAFLWNAVTQVERESGRQMLLAACNAEDSSPVSDSADDVMGAAEQDGEPEEISVSAHAIATTKKTAIDTTAAQALALVQPHSLPIPGWHSAGIFANFHRITRVRWMLLLGTLPHMPQQMSQQQHIHQQSNIVPVSRSPSTAIFTTRVESASEPANLTETILRTSLDMHNDTKLCMRINAQVLDTMLQRNPLAFRDEAVSAKAWRMLSEQLAIAADGNGDSGTFQQACDTLGSLCRGGGLIEDVLLLALKLLAMQTHTSPAIGTFDITKVYRSLNDLVRWVCDTQRESSGLAVIDLHSVVLAQVDDEQPSTAAKLGDKKTALRELILPTTISSQLDELHMPGVKSAVFRASEDDSNSNNNAESLCVLYDNGKVFNWGALDIYEQQQVPTQVAEIPDAVTLLSHADVEHRTDTGIPALVAVTTPSSQMCFSYSDKFTSVPKHVGSIKGVTHVSCGASHTLFRTNRSVVFAQGDNSAGQCMPFGPECLPHPQLVMDSEGLLAHVSLIGAGVKHSVFVVGSSDISRTSINDGDSRSTTSETVYWLGAYACGRSGKLHTADVELPFGRLATDTAGQPNEWSPCALPLPNLPESEVAIEGLAVGDSHALVIVRASSSAASRRTEEKEELCTENAVYGRSVSRILCFALGSNGYGQCGGSDLSSQDLECSCVSHMRAVEWEGPDFSHAALGEVKAHAFRNCSLLQTQSGELWCWGQVGKRTVSVSNSRMQRPFVDADFGDDSSDPASFWWSSKPTMLNNIRVRNVWAMGSNPDLLVVSLRRPPSDENNANEIEVGDLQPYQKVFDAAIAAVSALQRDVQRSRDTPTLVIVLRRSHELLLVLSDMLGGKEITGRLSKHVQVLLQVVRSTLNELKSSFPSHVDRVAEIVQDLGLCETLRQLCFGGDPAEDKNDGREDVRQSALSLLGENFPILFASNSQQASFLLTVFKQCDNTPLIGSTTSKAGSPIHSTETVASTHTDEQRANSASPSSANNSDVSSSSNVDDVRNSASTAGPGAFQIQCEQILVSQLPRLMSANFWFELFRDAIACEAVQDHNDAPQQELSTSHARKIRIGRTLSTESLSSKSSVDEPSSPLPYVLSTEPGNNSPTILTIEVPDSNIHQALDPASAEIHTIQSAGRKSSNTPSLLSFDRNSLKTHAGTHEGFEVNQVLAIAKGMASFAFAPNSRGGGKSGNVATDARLAKALGHMQRGLVLAVSLLQKQHDAEGTSQQEADRIEAHSTDSACFVSWAYLRDYVQHVTALACKSLAVSITVSDNRAEGGGDGTTSGGVDIATGTDDRSGIAAACPSNHRREERARLLIVGVVQPLSVLIQATGLSWVLDQEPRDNLVKLVLAADARLCSSFSEEHNDGHAASNAESEYLDFALTVCDTLFLNTKSTSFSQEQSGAPASVDVHANKPSNGDSAKLSPTLKSPQSWLEDLLFVGGTVAQQSLKDGNMQTTYKSSGVSELLNMGKKVALLLSKRFPIPAIHRFKFRNKTGEADVWKAHEALFTALAWHCAVPPRAMKCVFEEDRQQGKLRLPAAIVECWKAASGVLTWINLRHQNKRLSYAEIAPTMSAQAQLLLSLRPAHLQSYNLLQTVHAAVESLDADDISKTVVSLGDEGSADEGVVSDDAEKNISRCEEERMGVLRTQIENLVLRFARSDNATLVRRMLEERVSLAIERLQVFALFTNLFPQLSNPVLTEFVLNAFATSIDPTSDHHDHHQLEEEFASDVTGSHQRHPLVGLDGCGVDVLESVRKTFFEAVGVAVERLCPPFSSNRSDNGSIDNGNIGYVSDIGNDSSLQAERQRQQLKLLRCVDIAFDEKDMDHLLSCGLVELATNAVAASASIIPHLFKCVKEQEQAAKTRRSNARLDDLDQSLVGAGFGRYEKEYVSDEDEHNLSIDADVNVDLQFLRQESTGGSLPGMRWAPGQKHHNVQLSDDCMVATTLLPTSATHVRLLDIHQPRVVRTTEPHTDEWSYSELVIEARGASDVIGPQASLVVGLVDRTCRDWDSCDGFICHVAIDVSVQHARVGVCINLRQGRMAVFLECGDQDREDERILPGEAFSVANHLTTVDIQTQNAIPPVYMAVCMQSCNISVTLETFSIASVGDGDDTVDALRLSDTTRRRNLGLPRMSSFLRKKSAATFLLHEKTNIAQDESSEMNYNMPVLGVDMDDQFQMQLARALCQLVVPEAMWPLDAGVNWGASKADRENNDNDLDLDFRGRRRRSESGGAERSSIGTDSHDDEEDDEAGDVISMANGVESHIQGRRHLRRGRVVRRRHSLGLEGRSSRRSANVRDLAADTGSGFGVTDNNTVNTDTLVAAFSDQPDVAGDGDDGLVRRSSNGEPVASFGRDAISWFLGQQADKDATVYACGQNSYDELALGDHKLRRELVESMLLSELQPVQVVAGNEVTGVLTAKGQVFTVGFNRTGACGVGVLEGSKKQVVPSSWPSPVRVRGLDRIFVKRLCASNGSEHMFAIGSNDQVWAWGFNKYGQLGIGLTTDVVVKPSLVAELSDRRVCNVVNSYSHSLALTRDGAVYAFGLNSRGQLGIGSVRNMWSLPQLITRLQDIGPVVSVAAGAEHSVVCTASGKVLAFGRNNFGQLGIGAKGLQFSSSPMLVGGGSSRLRDLRCEQVACGYYFTVVIAEGSLHSFGQNDYGQLGCGHTRTCHSPTAVRLDRHVRARPYFISVSCGTGHTVACASGGLVIAWGRNKMGSVGDGSVADHPFPVQVNQKGAMAAAHRRGMGVLSVAAGFHHTVMLTGSADHFKHNASNDIRAWLPARLCQVLGVADMGWYTIAKVLGGNGSIGGGSREHTGKRSSDRTALRSQEASADSTNARHVVQLAMLDWVFEGLVALATGSGLPMEKQNKSNSFPVSRDIDIYLDMDVGPVDDKCVVSRVLQGAQTTSARHLRALKGHQLMHLLSSVLISGARPVALAKHVATTSKYLNAVVKLALGKGAYAVSALRALRSILATVGDGSGLNAVDKSVTDALQAGDTIRRFVIRLSNRKEAGKEITTTGVNDASLAQENEGAPESKNEPANGGQIGDEGRNHQYKHAGKSTIGALLLLIGQVLWPRSQGNDATPLQNSPTISDQDSFRADQHQRRGFALASELVALVRVLLDVPKWRSVVNSQLADFLQYAPHLTDDLRPIMAMYFRAQGMPIWALSELMMAHQNDHKLPTEGQGKKSQLEKHEVKEAKSLPIASETRDATKEEELSVSVWGLFGALAVLGGNIESIRTGGKVRMVTGEGMEGKGQEGVVLWYKRGANPMAQVAISYRGGQEVVDIRDDAELFAVADVPVPVHALEASQRVLSVLARLVGDSVNKSTLADDVASGGHDVRFEEVINGGIVYACLLQEQARMRAAMVVRELLAASPSLVRDFVSRGLLPQITSLISGDQNAIGATPLPVLEQRMSISELWRRRVQRIEHRMLRSFTSTGLVSSEEISNTTYFGIEGRRPTISTGGNGSIVGPNGSFGSAGAAAAARSGFGRRPATAHSRIVRNGSGLAGDESVRPSTHDGSRRYSASASEGDVGDFGGHWICTHCTFENVVSDTACNMCCNVPGEEGRIADLGMDAGAGTDDDDAAGAGEEVNRVRVEDDIPVKAEHAEGDGGAVGGPEEEDSLALHTNGSGDAVVVDGGSGGETMQLLLQTSESLETDWTDGGDSSGVNNGVVSVGMGGVTACHGVAVGMEYGRTCFRKRTRRPNRAQAGGFARTFHLDGILPSVRQSSVFIASLSPAQLQRKQNHLPHISTSPALLDDSPHWRSSRGTLWGGNNNKNSNSKHPTVVPTSSTYNRSESPHDASNTNPAATSVSTSTISAPPQGDAQVLCLVPGQYLCVEHGFNGNGGDDAVYLNEYSLVLDILIPAHVLASTAFLPLLQTDMNNQSFAEWYIRSDGSTGCVHYSRPGVVRADTWHRVAMVTNLTLHRVRYYVDGELCVEVKAGMEVPCVSKTNEAANNLSSKDDNVAATATEAAATSMSTAEALTRAGTDVVSDVSSVDDQPTEDQIDFATDTDGGDDDDDEQNNHAAIDRKGNTTPPPRNHTPVPPVTLVDNNDKIRKLILAQDDRWALDSAFFVGLESIDTLQPSELWVASLQIRCYAMASEEVHALGVASGLGIIPEPSDESLSRKLARDLCVPRPWCSQALERCGFDMSSAAAWLKCNENVLISKTRSEAAMLLALGFPHKTCVEALCAATSLTDAIDALMAGKIQPIVSSESSTNNVIGENINEQKQQEGEEEKKAQVARSQTTTVTIQPKSSASVLKQSIVDALVRSRGNFVMNDMLTLNGAADDDDQRDGPNNRTYHIYRSSRHAAADAQMGDSEGGEGGRGGSDDFGGSGDVANGFSLGNARNMVATPFNAPLSLGQGTAKLGAVALQTAHALFIAYARLATVAIIENSVEDTPVSVCTAEGSIDPALVVDVYEHTEESEPPSPVSTFDVASVDEGTVVNLSKEQKEEKYQQHQLGITSQSPPVNNWILSDTIGGKNFLRNYLRAFPLSLRKDLALTQSTRASVDPHDAIQVIRRKLWHMFLTETSLSTSTSPHINQRSNPKGMDDLVTMAEVDAVAVVGVAKQVKPLEQHSRGSRTVAAHRGTATNALVQDALHELVLLARGPWRLLPCGLQAGPAVQFSKLWSDKLVKTKEISDPLYRGKRTEERVERESSIAVYRPFADSGFSILGDVAITSNTSISKVSSSVLVVSDDDGYGGKTLSADGMPLLARPVGYEVVWRDVGLEANKHVALWRPIPPEGYVALGCVAIKGRKLQSPAEDSSLSQLRCVHKTCVTPSVFKDGLWSFEPPSAEEAAALAAAEEESNPSMGGKHQHATLPQGVSFWEVLNEARTFIPRVAPLSVVRDDQDEENESIHDNENDIGAHIGIGSTHTANRGQGIGSVQPSAGSVSPRRRARAEHEPYASFEASSRTLPLFDVQGDGDGQDSANTAVGSDPLAVLRISRRTGSVEDIKTGESSGLEPFHLGAVGNNQGDGTGSPELALWILQLLSEFDTTHGFGEEYSSKVFSEQMLYAVLRFSRTANTEAFRIKALRMTAAVIRRAPLSAFTPEIRQDLVSLREFMEDMHARQTTAVVTGLDDAQVDQVPLLSSLLCALIEVFMAISHRNGDANEDSIVDDKNLSLGMDVDSQQENNIEQNGVETLQLALANVDQASSRNVINVGTVEGEGTDSRVNVEVHVCDVVVEGEEETKCLTADENEGQHGYGPGVNKSSNASSATSAHAQTVSPNSSAALTSRQPSREELSAETKAAGLRMSYALLQCQQPWFQQLVEMDAIVKSLLYRRTVDMPFDFLMAEDTFMKIVLADKTALVENAQHPYLTNSTLQGHEHGSVDIPEAEALLVRFDRMCSTRFGDALQLTSGGSVLETLQGCFGGCTVYVPRSSFSYNFPIKQELNWGLCGSSRGVGGVFKGPDIKVSSHGRNAMLRKDKTWQTVFADSGFSCGINMWEVRVDKTTAAGNIFFGVATLSANPKHYLGSDDQGWGWIGCMACWHKGRKIKQPFGKRLKTGDVIRVTLDIPRRALSVARNGEDMGVAFDRLPLPSTVRSHPDHYLFPAFAFYNKEDEITLLSGSPSTITLSSAVKAAASANAHGGGAGGGSSRSLLPMSAASLLASWGGGGAGGGGGGGDGNSSSSGRRRTGSESAGSDTVGGGASDNASHNSPRRQANRRQASRRGTSRVVVAGGSGSVNRAVDGGGASASAGAGGFQASHAVPAKRAIAAQTLAALGYPVTWCIRALEACADDVAMAAEYLITNSHLLEQEAESDEVSMAAEAKLQTRAEEDRWLAEVARELDIGNRSTNSVLKNDVGTNAVGEISLLRASPSNCSLEGFNEVDGDNSFGDSLESRATTDRHKQKSKRKKNGKSKGDNCDIAGTDNGGDDEWGFRFTVSPLFSPEVSRQLAQEERSQERLARIKSLFDALTLEHDCEIVMYVNERCDKVGADSLMLSPEEIRFSHVDAFKYPRLMSVPLVTLQLRFLLLRNFNRRLASVVPLVDLSCADHESELASSLRRLRGLMLKSVKMTLFERVLADSHVGDDYQVRKEKKPLVKVDRNMAAQFLKTGECDVMGTRSVFGQLFQQLHIQQSDDMGLRNSHRAWYTVLVGESADDYGGPYRDVFNQACQELMSHTLPLFVPCPNAVALAGQNQEKWLPNPIAKTPSSLAMLEFVGKLMGIAMRTKNPMVVSFPSLVWKTLCRDATNLDDVIAIDAALGEHLRRVEGAHTPDAWTMLETVSDIRFVVAGADMIPHELIPNGDNVRVQWTARDHYLDILRRFKLNEIALQCNAIARGLATQVPRNFLSLFTWQELETMVCGPVEVDTDLLRENSTYGEGLSDSHPLVQMFWKVLKECDQEDRQRYLRFVWGRSRLPVSVADWDRKHKVSILKKDNPDDYFPIGHTCFFTVDLPMYTSLEICRQKLLYAVTHCVAIDADETTAARLAAEGGQWTSD